MIMTAILVTSGSAHLVTLLVVKIQLNTTQTGLAEAQLIICTFASNTFCALLLLEQQALYYITGKTPN